MSFALFCSILNLKTRKQRGTKEPLKMKVKKECEKADLKVNFQKT